MQSSRHIHKCPCAASSSVPGKENQAKAGLSGPKDALDRALEDSVSIRKDLERRHFLFVCFQDVVWICFSVPPGLTFRPQNSVLENLNQ